MKGGPLATGRSELQMAVPHEKIGIRATSVTAFGVGLLNLHSVMGPVKPANLHCLQSVFSLEFMYVSRYFALLIGFALVAVSFNLLKRKRRARTMSCRRVPLLRRIHLIEIHDQPWFPSILRDYVTDALQLIFDVGSVYKPIVGRLRKALEVTKANRVLDLCSGAGGPWLCRVFEQERCLPINILLTDRYPNARAFEQARMASRSNIYFHPESVSATEIPIELCGFRTLFTSFHHFRPHEARAILQDAVDRQQGIGIFEVPRRHVLTMLFVFLIPAADLVLTPFIRPFRWSRLIWTYLIPIIPIVLWFDGIVSCIRIYSPQELWELTDGLPANGFRWNIGEETGGFLPLPVTYLIGYPNSTATKENVTSTRSEVISRSV
jgi:hypothetical protein